MKKTNTIFTKLHADLLRFISKSLPNKTSRYDAFMYLLESLQDMDVISVKGDVSGITICVLHLVPDHDIPDRF